jgi:hypothetical protein
MIWHLLNHYVGVNMIFLSLLCCSDCIKIKITLSTWNFTCVTVPFRPSVLKYFVTDHGLLWMFHWVNFHIILALFWPIWPNLAQQWTVLIPIMVKLCPWIWSPSIHTLWTLGKNGTVLAHVFNLLHVCGTLAWEFKIWAIQQCQAGYMSQGHLQEIWLISNMQNHYFESPLMLSACAGTL